MDTKREHRTHAEGSPRGNPYDLSYSPLGRLIGKFRDNNSVTLSASVDMAYGYCDENQPHAVRRIFDDESHQLFDLRWDEAGNLGQVSMSKPGEMFEAGRFLFWTEDNRMHAAVDDRYTSYYAYDHSGERRLKLTGDNKLLDVNADFMATYTILNEPTLYPSAYMVLTNKGYTNVAKAESRASLLALPRRSSVTVRKHYYAGTERVAARLGGGGLDALYHAIGNNNTIQTKANLLFDQSLEQVNNRILYENDLDCIMHNDFAKEEFGHRIDDVPSRMQAGVEPNHDQFRDMMNSMLADLSQGDEPDVYFYHSDHLGSASWITNQTGNAVQHLQYLPFGERYIDQRTAGYQERFTFTGKDPRKGWRIPLNEIKYNEQRDEETGYGYFGARYMDHELMTMWLSVDPMADKYPSMSPYNYCAGNPVKLVDPDGNDWYLNTETKQIYYNSGARGSNDAGKYGRMQGQKGWSWIGENNMFKETSGKDDRQLSREYFKYSQTQQKGYSIDKSNVGQLVPIFETDILIPSSEYRKFKKENFGREFSFSIKFDLCIGTGGSYDLGIGRKRNGERFVFSTRSVSVGESVGISVNLNFSSLDSYLSSDGSSSNISASHGLITGSLGPGGYSIGVGVGTPGATYSESTTKTKRIK